MRFAPKLLFRMNQPCKVKWFYDKGLHLAGIL